MPFTTLAAVAASTSTASERTMSGSHCLVAQGKRSHSAHPKLAIMDDELVETMCEGFDQKEGYGITARQGEAARFITVSLLHIGLQFITINFCK